MRWRVGLCVALAGIAFLCFSEAKPQSKSYYDILGVEPTAEPKEIKRAYHQLALRVRPFFFLPHLFLFNCSQNDIPVFPLHCYRHLKPPALITTFSLPQLHPDKQPDFDDKKKLEAKFALVTKAYNILSDSIKREACRQKF